MKVGVAFGLDQVLKEVPRPRCQFYLAKVYDRLTVTQMPCRELRDLAKGYVPLNLRLCFFELSLPLL
jgi:hypothetical protein